MQQVGAAHSFTVSNSSSSQNDQEVKPKRLKLDFLCCLKEKEVQDIDLSSRKVELVVKSIIDIFEQSKDLEIGSGIWKNFFPYIRSQSKVDEIINSTVIPEYKKLKFCNQTSLWIELFEKQPELFRYLINHQKMYSHFTSHQSKVYQQIMSSYYKKELPDITEIHADAPINFIWIGSLIPDIYFRNVVDMGRYMNDKTIILWKDRNLLKSEENEAMEKLHTHHQFAGIKLKVLDVQDIEFEKMLPNTGAKTKEAYRFLTRDLQAYGVASDVLRFAILTMGSDVVDQASKGEIKREHSSMIYLDTDNVKEVRSCQDAWSKKDHQESDLKEGVAPAGLRFPRAMTKKGVKIHHLATAYKGHPIYESALTSSVDRLADRDLQKKIRCRYRAIREENWNRNSFRNYMDDLIEEGPWKTFSENVSKVFKNDKIFDVVEENYTNLPGINMEIIPNTAHELNQSYNPKDLFPSRFEHEANWHKKCPSVKASSNLKDI